MKELNFDTGLVTYSINGKAEVVFNPTDSGFAERLFTAFDELDKKQEAYKTELDKTEGPKSFFAAVRRIDSEMRGIIDTVFETPVSEDVFGSLNTYALSEGLPVWANLLLAVMDEIDGSFVNEQKKTNPRIQKYTSKYHK